MARFTQDYTMKGTPDSCFGAISQFMSSKGFEYTEYEGESVFKKGNGWIAAPTFVKVSFFGERARVEAWMKYALLPGVFVGELGMTGFVGCAAKGTMKNAATTIDRIMGGPAARIGCDPFLQDKNLDMGTAAIPQSYAPQPVAQPAPQPVPQPVPQPAPQAAPQPAVRYSAQFAPQTAPQPVPQPAVRYCGGCGAQLAPGVRFCPRCGKQNA